MNKGELIDRMHEECPGLSRYRVEQLLNLVLDTVVEEVAAGEKVQITGFGSFESTQRAERTGRNPQTGELVTIPARVAPKFKAGSGFKSLVNNS